MLRVLIDKSMQFKWVPTIYAFFLKLDAFIAALIVLRFNDTSTLVGHFVSSPTEREKREEIVQEMKETDRKKEEQETTEETEK